MPLANPKINKRAVHRVIGSSILFTLALSGCNPDPEPLSGQELYTEHECGDCHSAGESNRGFNLEAYKIYDQDDLAALIEDTMPKRNPTACVGECAESIAAYIATYHEFPEDPGSNTPPPAEPFACKQDRSFGNRALRPLTRDQYQRSVEDLASVSFNVRELLPPDDQSGAFFNNNNVSILSNSYSSYIQAAEEVASWLADRNFRGASDSCNSFGSQCYNDIIDNFAPKVFRRPLSSDEESMYQDIASGDYTEGDIKAGVELAIATMLSSPQFIYRQEIGESNNSLGSGAYELTDYEMATFLSYSLTGSTPDEQLLQAARSGNLSSSSGIREQARRLLDGSNAESLMGELVHLWLGTDVLDKFVKDSAYVADYQALTPLLEKELSMNFTEAMLDSSGKFEDIYTPGYTFVNQDLADHYDMSGASGNSFRKVNTDERGGILLSGAFLSLYGDSEDASPIRRSVYIRRNMLCQDIPPPPAGVETGRDAADSKHADELAKPTTTNRRHYHLVTSEGVCADCHNELINPLGFGLEDYDTVGRIRTQDLRGNQIDATGELYSPYQFVNFLDTPDRDTSSFPFYGGQGLAQLMSESTQAMSCLSQQIMSYSTGLDVLSLNDSKRQAVLDLNDDERHGYGCDVEDMKEILTNESPRAMLEQLGTLDTIRYRKAWNR